MKTTIIKGIIVVSTVFSCFVSYCRDVYRVDMSVKVPRVYDNMQSLGYRKYQLQKIRGLMTVEYDVDGMPEFQFSTFTNLTHKSGGWPITYVVSMMNEYPVWSYIGNNKTGVFKTPTVCMSLELFPSYALGTVPTEDNSLVVQFSGIGKSSMSGQRRVIRSVSCYLTGQLGCGCAEYGHVSPTRYGGFYGPMDFPVDISAVYGKCKLKKIE